MENTTVAIERTGIPKDMSSTTEFLAATMTPLVGTTWEWRGSASDAATNVTGNFSVGDNHTDSIMTNITDYFEFVENSTTDNFLHGDNGGTLRVGQTVLIGTVALCALVSNVLVILATAKRKDTLPRNIGYLACSMAVADFMLGLSLTFSIYPSTLGYWPYSDALCTAQAIVIDINRLIVWITLAYISVDRYAAVTSPDGVMQSRRFCGVSVCLTWTVALLWFVVVYSVKGNMRIAYAKRMAACIVKDFDSIAGLGVVFLVGSVVTWIFLIKTWQAMANHGQRAVAPPAANQAPAQSLGLAFRTLFALTAVQYLLWIPEASLALIYGLKLLKVPPFTLQSFRKATKSLFRDAISVLCRRLTGRDFFPTPVVEFQHMETVSQNATVNLTEENPSPAHRPEEIPFQEQPVRRSEQQAPFREQPVRRSERQTPSREQPVRRSEQAPFREQPVRRSERQTPSLEQPLRRSERETPACKTSNSERHLPALAGSEDVPENDQPPIQLESIQPTVPAVPARVSVFIDYDSDDDDDDSANDGKADMTQLPGMLWDL
ncbi:PREDICTED: uncharacterized protein LOC109487636 [Branchiostoma belcheri]|uniref:Uncharacterized protein LOC109487636 n=1 Tax=Branchiostoma belcheri TaxID=7741 RepID=A0A6P5A1P7_BRABE|nr:PREDICTED: uncharacterized protein LOC109487636 [Branchiostoma belcheri]